MIVLKINEWYGRFGNNILQLVRIIHCAIKTEALILYPDHPFIKNKILDFRKNLNDENIDEIYTHNFFENNKYFLSEFSIFEYKYILDTYVYDLIILVELSNNFLFDNDTLYISIRSGDIFNPHFFKNGGHPGYIQPSLSFYKNIIEKNNYKNIYLIAEDRSNPVINKLLELYPNIIPIIENSQSNYIIIRDFTILIHAKNLVLPNGSWGAILGAMNKNLVNLYISNFNYNKNELNISTGIRHLSLGYIQENTNIQIYNMMDYYINIYIFLKTDFRKALDYMITS